MRHLLVVGLPAVVAACGSPSPTPSPPSSPAVSATVREFGVLGDVDAEARTVSYLEAELFVDDEAQVEAAKDGRTAPNPFYVREGTTTRTLPVAQGRGGDRPGLRRRGQLLAGAPVGGRVPRP